jgi:hypothetical protein
MAFDSPARARALLEMKTLLARAWCRRAQLHAAFGDPAPALCGNACDFCDPAGSLPPGI